MKITSVPIPTPFDIPAGCFSPDVLQRILSMFHLQPMLQTVSGAIDPDTQQRLFVTKAGACAMTVTAPGSGSDHQVIEIVSTTDFAHTLVGSGLFLAGTGAKSTATFAAKAGACLRMVAFGGKFYVLDSPQMTFT